MEWEDIFDKIATTEDRNILTKIIAVASERLRSLTDEGFSERIADALVREIPNSDTLLDGFLNPRIVGNTIYAVTGRWDTSRKNGYSIAVGVKKAGNREIEWVWNGNYRKKDYNFSQNGYTMKISVYAVPLSEGDRIMIRVRGYRRENYKCFECKNGEIREISYTEFKF